MTRIAVLGPPGTGKSTFSRQLGEATGIPVTHLDAEFWEPGWEKPDREAWVQRHRELLAPESWILDGNYGSTLDDRLAAADLVVYLHVPRWVALFRVCKRWLQHRGGTRPDMAEGCPEKVDWEFVRYIWNFPREERPAMERKFDEHGVDVVRLSSQGEREAFLADCRTGVAP